MIFRPFPLLSHCRLNLRPVLGVALLLALPATRAAAPDQHLVADDYWGYAFDDKALPSTDALGYNETRVFAGTIEQYADGRSGLLVSQRRLAGLDAESQFDRLSQMMESGGQKMVGKKQAIVIGGLPAVSATYQDGNDLILLAATKAKAGERSWWFTGQTRQDPANPKLSIPVQSEIIRQSILSFKPLRDSERPAANDTLYVLPGRFQIRTAGFKFIDGTLQFDGCERVVQLPPDLGGGPFLSLQISAVRATGTRSDALAEYRKSMEEYAHKPAQVKQVVVSGRQAARLSLPGLPGELAVEVLWIWDTDLIWTVTATTHPGGPKNALLDKLFRDALGSFRLLREPRASGGKY